MPRTHALALLLSLGVWLPTLAPAAAQTLVVANKSDHTVDLIDLASGEVAARLPTGQAPHEVAVSPDGELAVVSNYGPSGTAGSTLTVIDLEEVEVMATVDLGRHRRPHGLAWISNDRLAVTTEGSKHLLVVDPMAGKVVLSAPTKQDVSHMVAVTPDGRRAFIANIGSGSVTVIDLNTGERLTNLATGKGAEGIDVTPDGKEVWIGNRESDTLTVLDTQTLEILADVPCPGFPIRVKVSPDGSRVLVSAARGGEVVLFDRAARKELRRAKLDLSAVPDAPSRLFGDQFGDSPVPVGLVIAPDGKTAWVAATQADVVVAIDPETLAVKGLLEAGREPDGMAYAPVQLTPPKRPR